MNDEKLTEKALAQRWGITVRCLQKWRKKGIGPRHTRIGERTVLYRMRDVLAYEAANTSGALLPAEGWDKMIAKAVLSLMDIEKSSTSLPIIGGISEVRKQLQGMIE